MVDGVHYEELGRIPILRVFVLGNLKFPYLDALRSVPHSPLYLSSLPHSLPLLSPFQSFLPQGPPFMCDVIDICVWYVWVV